MYEYIKHTYSCTIAHQRMLWGGSWFFRFWNKTAWSIAAGLPSASLLNSLYYWMYRPVLLRIMRGVVYWENILPNFTFLMLGSLRPWWEVLFHCSSNGKQYKLYITFVYNASDGDYKPAVHYLVCSVGPMMRIDCVTPHHCVCVCDNLELQFSEAAICCLVCVCMYTYVCIV